MNMPRTNPFADLSDFEPKSTSEPPASVPPALIERVAQDNGFPSRQPAQPAKASTTEPARKPGRRYTTGRNRQINIKATAEAIERLYKIADARHAPLGEVLEMALDALERQDAQAGKPSTT
jgi:hypothetical protein